jgi:phosphatidylglycerol:prolipoprotein diacylglycerol transferase
VGGFVGGHVLDSIFYHPETVVKEPLSLVKIWAGQSSFGGFTGAFLGLIYWKYKFKASTLVYADLVASAFPLSWVFGRTGCSLAHDHPGMLSDAWFAVRYPEGARFDLGLYEMVMTIPLAVTFLFLMKKPRPPGFFLGIMCIAYAPSRFALDFLRVHENDWQGHEADPRYWGLTPAQWGCLLLLAAGVWLAYHAARTAEKGPGWLAAAAPRFAAPEPSLEPSP